MSHGAKSQTAVPVLPTKNAGIPPTGASNKNSTVQGWQNFEHNIMINLSGQSGEKMDLIPSMDQSKQSSANARFYGNRQGLMTSSSNTRPTAMGKNLN